MKRELWVVILVVAAFMGVLIGYSVPPLIEVGIIGANGKTVGIKTDIDHSLEDYYKDLSSE